METNNEIITKVRQIMADQNINQVELSKKARVNPSSLSLFLRGKSGLSKRHMTALKAYVSTYYYIYECDNIPQEQVVETVIIEQDQIPFEQYNKLLKEN